MKKFLSLVLVSLLLLFTGIPVFAASPRISLGSASGAVGDIVQIPVTMTGNPGIISMSISISYDANSLSLNAKPTNGSVLTSPTFGGDITKTPYKLQWNMATDLDDGVNNTNNGTIATLSFKILKAGSHTVSVTMGGTGDIINAGYTDVYFATSDGTVTGNTQSASTYTVSYDANGGTGAPSSQTKTENVALTLSNTKPSKKYTITYNANGGSVSPSSKTLSCTFSGWNTSSSGSGASYQPGGTYTANANATLYAQWQNPTAGTLETPARNGYTFNGWYTASYGGSKVTSSTTVTRDMTLYAMWTANELPTEEHIVYVWENYVSYYYFPVSSADGNIEFGKCNEKIATVDVTLDKLGEGQIGFEITGVKAGSTVYTAKTEAKTIKINIWVIGLSQTEENIDVKNGETYTISFISNHLPSDVYLSVNYPSDITEAKWSEGDDGNYVLELATKAAGEGQLTLSVVDSETEETLNSVEYSFKVEKLSFIEIFFGIIVGFIDLVFGIITAPFQFLAGLFGGV